MAEGVDQRGRPWVDRPTLGRLWVVVVLAILGIALVGSALVTGVVLPALSSQARSQVEVTVVGESLRCRGARSSAHIFEGTTTHVRATIGVRPGMRCTVRFTVANHGPRSVTLQAVLFPLLGAGSGSSAEVVAVTGAGPAQADAFRDGPVDATFPIDAPIAPGQARSFVASIRHKVSGCMFEGGALTVFHQPVVTVDAWRRTGRVAGNATVKFTAPTDANDCSS